MEADQAKILALIDFNWFCHFILSRSLRLPPLPPKDEFPATTADSLTSEPPRHRSSRSDELTPPLQILNQTPTLQTISSGKVTTKYPAVSESREPRMRRDRYRQGSKRKKNWGSKSLSDLEFEELKGFMDMGFTFSDAEASDPWLVSILPGLQRLKPSESPLADSNSVARPYLSEAWELEEEEERSRVLRNWRTPADGEGVEIKDQLWYWARAVASAVL